MPSIGYPAAQRGIGAMRFSEQPSWMEWFEGRGKRPLAFLRFLPDSAGSLRSTRALRRIVSSVVVDSLQGRDFGCDQRAFGRLNGQPSRSCVARFRGAEADRPVG